MSGQTDNNKTKAVVPEIKIMDEKNKSTVEEVIISENEIRKLLDCSEEELEKLGKKGEEKLVSQGSLSFFCHTPNNMTRIF